MKYVSVNEQDKFSYEDCICHELTVNGYVAVLKLEALIVKSDNSANSNYTDSYADDTVLTIEGFVPKKLIKEGYKYYDANDNLIEDKPDEELEAGIINLEKKFSKVFLIGFTKREDNFFSIEFEIPDADPSAVTEVFEVVFEAEKITFSWDKYMNRVNR